MTSRAASRAASGWCAGALAIGLAAQGCAVRSVAPATLSNPGTVAFTAGWTQTGIASWYGVPFHGRATASGEIYDMNAMTAAHNTLPFGTRIRVDNRDNGRSTELTVNDRGPFVKGRILDVSRAGARALDMIGPGTAQVRISIVSAANPVSARGGCVVIQVGSYRERAGAERRKREVEQAGFKAIVERHDGFYRVGAGPFGDDAEMRRALGALGGFIRRC